MVNLFILADLLLDLVLPPLPLLDLLVNLLPLSLDFDDLPVSNIAQYLQISFNNLLVLLSKLLSNISLNLLNDGLLVPFFLDLLSHHLLLKLLFSLSLRHRGLDDVHLLPLLIPFLFLGLLYFLESELFGEDGGLLLFSNKFLDVSLFEADNALF